MPVLEDGRVLDGSVREPVRRFFKRVWRRETVTALLVASLKALAVIALPFLVYVRASVYLYRLGAHPWIAILVAAILTCGIVSGFIMLIARRFRRRARGDRDQMGGPPDRVHMLRLRRVLSVTGERQVQ